jgi:predicted metal-dependent hydrolase
MMRDLDQHGVELFNEGRYWEAHEAWEEAWTPDRHGPDRGFYKGLIQIAAGCLHYTRRNQRGALNKWRGGAAYLRPYLPQHRGLELAPLVSMIEANVVALSAASGSWPELPLPFIEGPPRREESADPHPPR